MGTVTEVTVIGREVHAKGHVESGVPALKHLDSSPHIRIYPAPDMTQPNTLMAVTLTYVPAWKPKKDKPNVWIDTERDNHKN